MRSFGKCAQEVFLCVWLFLCLETVGGLKNQGQGPLHNETADVLLRQEMRESHTGKIRYHVELASVEVNEEEYEEVAKAWGDYVQAFIQQFVDTQEMTREEHGIKVFTKAEVEKHNVQVAVDITRIDDRLSLDLCSKVEEQLTALLTTRTFAEQLDKFLRESNAGDELLRLTEQMMKPGTVVVLDEASCFTEAWLKQSDIESSAVEISNAFPLNQSMDQGNLASTSSQVSNGSVVGLGIAVFGFMGFLLLVVNSYRKHVDRQCRMEHAKHVQLAQLRRVTNSSSKIYKPIRIQEEESKV